jgi:hypothetical protein
MIRDFETHFIEAYVLTPKSVAPVTANDYSQLLAQFKAAEKWSDSLTKSFRDLNESLNDEEP